MTALLELNSPDGGDAMGRVTRFGTIVGIRAALAVMAALALTFPALSNAQESRCGVPCVTKRWESLENEQLRRAENLRRARANVRLATQTGDSALIAAANELLAKAQGAWAEIRESADTLSGQSYKAFLASQLVAREAEYDEARGQLAKKTAVLDRLRAVNADERERILRDMEGTIRVEEEQRAKLAITSVHASLRALVVKTEKAIEQASRKPGAEKTVQDLRTQLRLLKDLSKPTALDNLTAYEAIAKYGQPIVEALAKGTATASASVAAPLLLGRALDFAAIAQSHIEWQAAADRLQSNINAEFSLQADVEASRAAVKLADDARQVAAEQIARQRLFESQTKTISAELGR